MNDWQIKIGDIVNCYSHQGQCTICRKAVVLAISGGPGDSWVFKETHSDGNYIHYVSEPCTITKVQP